MSGTSVDGAVRSPRGSWNGCVCRRASRWLDVGCGTGALSAAILEQCAPSSVDGVEPSEGFLETAVDLLGSRVTFHRADAAALPLDDASFDAVVAGLVLNFVPDLDAALSEMTRVTEDGGVVAAYVWDYAGRMELIRWFWDVARELDPAAEALDEAVRFPDCTPEALTWRFAAAGLLDVETTGFEVPTVFLDFDDFWAPFLGGQGPAPAYAMSLEEPARERLRATLQERLPTRARRLHRARCARLGGAGDGRALTVVDAGLDVATGTAPVDSRPPGPSSAVRSYATVSASRFGSFHPGRT